MDIFQRNWHHTSGVLYACVFTAIANYAEAGGSEKKLNEVTLEEGGHDREYGEYEQQGGEPLE